MAITILSGSATTDGSVTPLLEEEGIVEGSVDYRGQPVHRSSSGGWTSAYFIMAMEVAERFAYYGIASNLVMYLTGPLGQSTAIAAQNVNTWSGTSTLLPLFGAFVADSFLGRYWTVVVASLVYMLGLGLLTVSAILTALDSSGDEDTKSVMFRSSSGFQVFLFFFSLYLVALGQGGHKPCVQAFGADQFDGKDPKESREKSSFFNWWTFSLNFGIIVALLGLVYVEDKLDWSLGFGIPCIVMLAALFVFLLGTKTYRYSIRRNDQNPFLRTAGMVARAIKTWRLRAAITREEEGNLSIGCCEQSKSHSKVLIAADGCREDRCIGSDRGDVEETMALLRLIPIWIASLGFAIVYAQPATFFTKQGATMSRIIFPGFEIPPASLQCFICISFIILLPVYDRIFVPAARAITGKPSGITMLQRIGTGLVFSCLCMVTAALVETRRVETAKEYGLLDLPNATVPMSIWWLAPQYIFSGLADVFAVIGLQEFFYDQVPMEFRSVGLSVYLSILGVGSFISSFLVSVIDKSTGGDGGQSWLSNNLNRAHLDYFYWLLSGLDAVGFITFQYFARSYIYGRGTTDPV